MIRRCAVSALAVATASTLVACSSSGGDKASPSSTPKSSATSSSAQPITQPDKVPTSVANDVKTRKQATSTSCSSISGGWEAKGTVKNTGSAKKTFTITIFFTTNPGGTVQAYGSNKVSVDAGATGNWTVSKKFAASKNTQCVLRGVA